MNICYYLFIRIWIFYIIELRDISINFDEFIISNAAVEDNRAQKMLANSKVINCMKVDDFVSLFELLYV